MLSVTASGTAFYTDWIYQADTSGDDGSGQSRVDWDSYLVP